MLMRLRWTLPIRPKSSTFSILVSFERVSRSNGLPASGDSYGGSIFGADLHERAREAAPGGTVHQPGLPK